LRWWEIVGWGQVEGRCQLADTHLAALAPRGDHRHQTQPDRIAQGFEDLRQVGGLHAVDIGAQQATES
jgi:hypothetical protein